MCNLQGETSTDCNLNNSASIWRNHRHLVSSSTLPVLVSLIVDRFALVTGKERDNTANMSLSDTLEPIGDSILAWADPEKQFRGHTEGWFLTDFTSAATIAAVYVGFVLIGSAVMKSSSLPAMDPYPLKFIYNVSQIMLCAYMTIEAFLLAYRNGYTVLPCNDYDTNNPPLAKLLWLFYISKVSTWTHT